ncbi:MAG: hypothetical protein C4519_19130 [Desulfobacteraceae bacterium]|nr:MAG: hypothetical protein C4519_19130 [Desulfobacteraceae bacterium]
MDRRSVTVLSPAVPAVNTVEVTGDKVTEEARNGNNAEGRRRVLPAAYRARLVAVYPSREGGGNLQGLGAQMWFGTNSNR